MLGTPVFKLPWIANYGCFLHLIYGGGNIPLAPFTIQEMFVNQSEVGRHM